MSPSVGLGTHIFNNNLKSVLLLMGFPFLLIMMIAAFFGGMNIMTQKSIAAGLPIYWDQAGNAAMTGIIEYGHIAIFAAGIWMVIAYFFHGSMIRAATGATPITRTDAPEIYNLLENLCISRGITMPSFDIIESPALNAFASGINEKNYRITLTRGLVNALPPDELEAVIAHELTHIQNRDVRLLIIAVVFAGMISFFAEMIFRSLFYGGISRGGNRNDRGGGALVALLAFAILMVGYVFALVIRFALSQKREYLADAGAVDLTKNPEAMMRALMRISGQDRVTGMTDDVQQMCIENSHPFMGLFATHPPIAKRIAAISQMTNTAIPTLAPIAPRAPRGPWG